MKRLQGGREDLGQNEGQELWETGAQRTSTLQASTGHRPRAAHSPHFSTGQRARRED